MLTMRAIGAETVIDYTTTAVESAARDVDLVFDTVGQETLPQSLRAVKRGGILISIDALASISGQRPSQEQARELGIRIASFSASTTSELLRTFAQLIDQGQIKAVVGTIFPLTEAAQAHTLSQSRHGRGRIVLHID
jgi:NADPH:quinone reductase-like Zn-dependent oxidoreductase